MKCNNQLKKIDKKIDKTQNNDLFERKRDRYLSEIDDTPGTARSDFRIKISAEATAVVLNFSHYNTISLFVICSLLSTISLFSFCENRMS